MEDRNARFDGSIPENYDRYLGPVLFQPFAIDLASRLNTDTAVDVLELACGTGILTRQLRRRLPVAARLVATDLNEGMLRRRGPGQLAMQVLNGSKRMLTLPFSVALRPHHLPVRPHVHAG